ncbi:MAG TPA: glycoside hydrolase family 2 TIM barrel-domain containing protein [Chthonomonadaceae bacterium]|nr:glycoside hydrolase family 2 TIM barrel-domain containing protein [Chthonomonadaceae bacterium]
MEQRSYPLLIAFCLLLCLGAGMRAEAQDYAWMEGEAAAINFKPNISGWGHKEFLSDEKWLQVSLDADKVDKELPAGGILLKYPFTLKKTGKYEVWNRIGYEFVRSSFDWRVDGSDWKTVKPDELTTDLMELQDWNEVAWLKMGEQQISNGAHTLEIRLPKTLDEKGKTARVLYASDALCVYPGAFHPYGKFKPGQDYRQTADLEAAKKVFNAPVPTEAGKRASVPLNGMWEVCRFDEQLPGEVAAPIKDFPEAPHWVGITVPGDKMQRPELVMAHRLWYRTRINVPAALAGRSFHLVFPQNNLNTTVYVNKVYCGFNKNPFAHFELDVTPGIKPGVNEIWVGIKDAYYGYSANPKDPLKLRKRYNLPLSFTHMGFQDLAYPVWNAFQSGILQTPEFVVAGPVKVADVFCKPSVAQRELAAEITLRNTTPKAVTGELTWEAINGKTGQVEKTFAAKPFSLKADGEQTLVVSDKWENPKLWWPDDPNLYTLRTTVKIGGKPVDSTDTPFGFREWTLDGIHFKLNGVVFHGYHDAHGNGSKEEWLDFHHKTHQAMMRFWGTSWFDLSPDAALDWFDKNGVVVRRQGMLDGEAIGYMAIENDPVLKQLTHSEVKLDLMQNWRDQMVAQVKGERNHPSIMLWSIENEWLYINCINLYGGLMDPFEAEVAKTSTAVQQADPTRPTMTDGGGANANQTMPVHGNHYVVGDFAKYPGLAYQDNVTGGGRGRWVWDKKRPRYIGEDYFIAGVHPELSTIGGEAVFAGKQAQLPAAGLMARILNEGYRWADYGAWDLYMQPGDGDGSQYNSLSPRAVLCRQWDWTFGSGQKIPRTFGIFNDTRFDAPIAFTWTLTVGGKQIAKETTEHRVAPGANEKFDVTLTMPQATQRTEGELALTLAVQGKEVFRDVKAVSVLPMGAEAGDAAQLAQAGRIAVYDPAGSVAAFLKGRGVAFTPLQSLQTLPEDAKVLVVGKDALDARESASSRLAAYASAGRTVIVLEQKNPLRYQALPAQIETGENEGRAAFAEDLDHPALKGLKQKDFFTWGADAVVYRNAYFKPARGGKSLIQCDNLLQNSALVEIPVDSGLLLLSQLTLEEKLPTNAVAQQLLANLIGYGASYKRTYRDVAASRPENTPFAHALDAIGLNYAKANDPLQALSHPGSIALIAATPENLHTLAANGEKVAAFTGGGGWIVLNGLTPEGLADYNKLVGFEHMIRPFKRERVTFPPIRSPLTAGIPTGDIVMYSSQRIFNFQEGNYVVSDEFNYVVDLDEVAPFGKSPFFAYDNITNNFVSADGWPLIINYPIPANGPSEVPITLPKPQTITEFTWVGNTFYYPQTKVNLVFDGKDKVEFDTQPNNEPQTFAINPPRTATQITLQIAGWIVKPDIAPNIGIDNIYFKAQRPPDFAQRVRPMLNIGGMVEYPRGQGGIVLCNLNFKESEEVSENLTKKRNILATLLRNLKAPFSGGATVIAGANLQYVPIDLSKQATQYRDERGWFGDKAFTFKDLPTGRQTFAGVPFQVYDFPTSPVPTVVMLQGSGVPNTLPDAVHGIPVNRKADALFFLHTARMDARRNDQERREKKQYEMLRYVVTYADGQTANIPIYAETDIEDYRQQSPAAIPGAQIGWTKRYEGTDFSAVAYVKQWNNPRPDVTIRSVDMVYGDQKRGVPVLIALTAATSK